MRTTIDRAGRIVIPKAMREELGLVHGGEVEIELRDDGIEISVPYAVTEVATGPDDKPVLVLPANAPQLSLEDIRAAIEAARR